MTIDPHSPLLTTPPGPPPVSGFWRRVTALLIDSVLLGTVGMVPALFAFDFLASLGAWGRLLGFMIALPYFSIGNCRITGGQTLGKRAMKIRVVGPAGRPIGLGRSSVRYVIVATPYFLNGAGFGSVSLWITTVAGLIVFGLGGAIVYLFVFNRRTRQSAHDLATDTFVVRTEGAATPPGPVWRGHYAILGGLAAVSIGAAAFLPKLAQFGPIPEVLALQQAVQDSGLVHTSSVLAGKSWSSRNGQSTVTRTLQVRLILRERPRDPAALARQIGRVIRRSYPAVAERDWVSISLSYGYDLGIARAWSTQTFRCRPNELGTKPAPDQGTGSAPDPAPPKRQATRPAPRGSPPDK